MTRSAKDWTARAALEADGFTEFVPFSELTSTQPPTQPGVYLVLRKSEAPPVFLEVNPAGWVHKRDPTASVQELEQRWVPGCPVLYIGKAGGARGLRQRLAQYRRNGAGHRAAHAGGQHIWQLTDSHQLLVAWRPTPDEDPEDVEARMLGSFHLTYDRRPFANRKDGRHPRSRGLSS